MSGEDAAARVDVRTVILDTPAQARALMAAVGVAAGGVEIMAAKFTGRALYVKGLHPVAANIVKQAALSAGGEAAVNRDAVSCRVPASDALLFGTQKQLAAVGRKLTGQAFGLDDVGRAITAAVGRWGAAPVLTLRGKPYQLTRPLLMGILNVTPDSFADGGRYVGVAKAVRRGREMAEQGATLVDVGGESTRPGAAAVGVEDELERIVPVVEQLAPDVLVSVDTRKAAVAQAAADAGAAMVNDVSAGRDDSSIARVCARAGLPYVIMHMQGKPADMQDDPRYDDVVGEVRRFLAARAAWAEAEGVKQLVVDPGIGFGKTLEHNLALVRGLPALCDLGYPVLVGHSRKRFIGALTGEEVEGRLAGSLAAAVEAARRGAHLLRVHDVRETAEALKVIEGIAGWI
jgi:dihydropteroate synthase